jgi:hypothetical protein
MLWFDWDEVLCGLGVVLEGGKVLLLLWGSSTREVRADMMVERGLGPPSSLSLSLLGWSFCR